MTQPAVRQRHGLVGSTNLAARPRDCDNGQPAAHTPTKPTANKAPPTYAASPSGEGGSPRRKRKTAGAPAGAEAGRDGRKESSGAPAAEEGEAGADSLRYVRRDKFRLPLVSSITSSGASISNASAPEPGASEETKAAEAQLARNIDEYERKSKSFKDEPWYKSPIGGGSKKSVLLVALQQRDLDATGQIRREDVEAALGGVIFGLKPHHIRDLLADYTADKDAPVDYRRFVETLKLPQERPDQDPLIYRQQSYIEKVRARSQALLQQASPQPSPAADAAVAASSTASAERKPQPSFLLPLVSPVKVAASGPHKDAVRGSTGREEDACVVGAATNPPSVLPPLISPLHTNPEPPTPDRAPEVDRLSFEYDKQRKQRRADAKARTLLAHITRVEEYSRRQQQLAESHDNLRLAAKAMHRQEHFERAFSEENRVLRIVQKQGKGGLRSAYSHMQQNVSKDSMFNVDPVWSKL